ncbi:MAG: hemolysin family protein [Planctomycetota bacterium]|nr:hemolysin family protein [Planctomycetota bacterium]
MGWEAPAFAGGLAAAAFGAACGSAFATYSHARIARILSRMPEPRRSAVQDRVTALIRDAEEYLFASSLFHVAGLALAALAAAGWFVRSGACGAHDPVQPVAVAALAIAAAWLLGILLPTAAGYGVGEEMLVRYGAPIALLLAPARLLVRPALWLGRKLGGEAGPLGTDASKVVDEVQSLISHGQRAGALESREGRMISSIVEFHDKTVRDIMTPRTDVRFIAADSDIQEAVRTVIESGHTRFPVYEGSRDNIIGMLHAKDLLGISDYSKKLKDVPGLVREAHFVPAARRLHGLLEELERKRAQIAVAVDEYGGTAGVVTVEDVVEEIVGEIRDEYDEDAPPALKALDPATIEADGRVRIEEINRALGCSLDANQGYDTIAGFVLSSMGRIPARGERIERDGVEVVVLSADERRVGRVRVRLLSRETD